MSIRNATAPDAGLTLRQAALTAGFAYLLNPVVYAESMYSKLVVAGQAEQTAQNIANHSGLFLAVTLSYFLSFIGDIVLAWALYHLLALVNKALSMLMAWFQLIYAAIALCGTFDLFSALRIVSGPEYLALFGAGTLHGQVMLLLNSFRADWNVGLILFGVHLVLLGVLIVLSSYVPKIIGVLLVVNGLGWVVSSLQPYLFPEAHIGFVSVTFFGELVFMLWLLIRGWVLRDADASAPA